MATQKSPKKRSASSQAGPVLKKVRMERKIPDRSAIPEKFIKKRSRPVTLPQNDHPESDEDEDEELDGDSVQLDAATLPQKNLNASRDSHKAQRSLHQQRRAAKPYSTLLIDAKRIWSLAQQKNLQPAKRQTHIRALMDVVRGKVKELVLKHDASRIVQTVVKYGGKNERNEVAAELKGGYKDLVQSRYSKFLVKKLIRLCPTHRPAILQEFQSQVMRLLLHREASSVLSDAFELYANAYERAILLRDFYGKETALFSVLTESDEDKERAKRGLSGVLDGLEAERRQRVLASVKDNLVAIFNNPDKGAVTHAIVHRVLWEYLIAITDVSDDPEREKLWREMFECCQDVLAEMVHTRDGSRVVRNFLARGNAKDRKHIVKVLKPHVIRMCTDEEAQNVLFTALDIIDDTKLTTKAFVHEIASNARSLCASPHGRRALLYLLVPRTTRHFTPSQIATLSETDALRAKTSKKDDSLRESEIRTAASQDLLTFVVEMGVDVARETGGSLVITEIMLHAKGDKSAAMNVLLKAISAPYPSNDATQPHPIDLPHTSRMYKMLLQGGHYSHTTRSISRSERFSARAFASAYMETVSRETTVGMAHGNGAFVVAELCERILEVEEGDEGQGNGEEKEKLKAWFGEQNVVREIEESEAKGKKVLLEKLTMLSGL